MASEVVNFSAGPSALPRPVLERVQAELLDYRGHGVSLIEQSHRGADYDEVHHRAMEGIRRLLQVPESHDVVFIQGGASGMFATVPLNFLPPGTSADYILTGRWSEKALGEALRVGTARSAGSGKRGDAYVRIPGASELSVDPEARYLHLTSNNTVVGTQFRDFPETTVPLVADMSSDILARPVDISRFHLIYAGAQKNLGPAGLVVVVARRDWMETARNDIPAILRLSTHAAAGSLHHTPPTFAVYVLSLVLDWVEGQGGLEAMIQGARDKSRMVYDAIDDSGGFYRGCVEPEARSQMNVTFRLSSNEAEAAFLAAADADGFIGLSGHRSVGGIRVSLYNAVPTPGVERFVDFMQTFRTRSSN